MTQILGKITLMTLIGKTVEKKNPLQSAETENGLQLSLTILYNLCAKRIYSLQSFTICVKPTTDCELFAKEQSVPSAESVGNKETAARTNRTRKLITSENYKTAVHT